MASWWSADAPLACSRLRLALALFALFTCGVEALSTPSPDAGRTTRRDMALPSPFDDGPPSLFQGAGSDDRCVTFMANLLSDGTFKSCHPVSMLLQTSTALFEAEKQTTSLVRVLDAACSVDVSVCADYLTKAAERLGDRANCRAELDQSQPRVVQAQRGLRAYRTLYAASCLEDGGVYCFAQSASNLSDPSNSYLYFIPLGMALPGASTPSCNRCTRDIMNVYHASAANRGHLVSEKYAEAAQQINVVCGPGFVNATLPRPKSAAGGRCRHVLPVAAVVILAMML
ncbi:hypothetical protein L249_2157 [Ophiocordyceps polyrhachis-furcata BCC 54312]|uniref:DUF7729 domain-containing protein n=1 Tax=Ophiocordyceps polyrhachis-furcata BCC 54312 TaxID=1330021 RepID=A0A367LPK2_9HYPO|nr:hypothetical protein L249_2157 [Ophiocordyceps polyrhachis-furcata BCC 54312]